MMITLICVLLAVGAHGAYIPKWRNGLDPKIVGGGDIPIDVVPYQVSFQLMEQHICGGSILNKNTILTAAHCTSPYLSYISEMRVEAGVSKLYTSDHYYYISKIIQHEKFNSTNLDYDIAILKLNESIEFNIYQSPIELQDTGVEVPVGKPAVITGWGALKYRGSSPLDLQFAMTQISDTAECTEDYKHTVMKVTDRMFCSDKVGISTCQGDSGGPINVDDKLVGVVSWGRGCAYPKSPNVFAKVSNLRPWIEAHINDE